MSTMLSKVVAELASSSPGRRGGVDCLHIARAWWREALLGHLLGAGVPVEVTSRGTLLDTHCHLPCLKVSFQMVLRPEHQRRVRAMHVLLVEFVKSQLTKISPLVK